VAGMVEAFVLMRRFVFDAAGRSIEPHVLRLCLLVVTSDAPHRTAPFR
jgi:hypothetical protein